MIESHTGDGLTELIRQHRRLRTLLFDLVDYTRGLELDRCPDCPMGAPVERACTGLATLEWGMFVDQGPADAGAEP